MTRHNQAQFALSIQNKSLRNLTQLFLITQTTKSTRTTSPLKALDLPIPQVVNELHTYVFFRSFFSISRLELFIASLAWGYKVSNTIEPVKTDDCLSDCAFRPHEPKGCGKKTQKKGAQKQNKNNSTDFICFERVKGNYLTSTLSGAKLNAIKR